jgi:hypothetical protein
MRNTILSLFLTCSTAFTALGARPTNYPTVSLKVTVNASQQFDTAATDILSDGAGAYADGQNGVCATLNGNGDLIVDFDCLTVSTPRQLGLNLAAFLAPPTGGTNACTPPLSISPGSLPGYVNHLSTAQPTDQSTAAFQAMKTYDGTAATVYYIEMFIATKFSDTSQTVYRLNYHGVVWSSFSDASLASYVQVRRITNTQWVVEPVAPSGLAGNPANAAMLVRETTTKHQSTTTECGFYQVPFSFTLDQR